MSTIIKLITKNVPETLIIVLTIVLLSFSFIEHVTPDSAGYLRETMLITQLIQGGEWMGNYGVGIHGFLYKIPLAIVFLITGPSILAGSIYTVILSILTIIVFYRILQREFGSPLLPIFGVALLVINYRFVISSITYLREIPLILSILLFLDSVISKRSVWYVGLCLLLIFDAKEYMFFALAPSYFIWGLIYELKSNNSLKTAILPFVYRMLAAFTPSLILLFLMFYSSLVPVNMFAASLLGVVDKGFHEVNNLNIVILANNVRESGNAMESGSSVSLPFKLISDYFFSLFSSKNFSFESLPLTIFFPSLIMSVISFRKWFKDKKQTGKLILPMVFIGFFLIYLLRLGKARYLFPIIPLSVMFFIYFLQETNHKVVKNVILFTLGALVISIPGEHDHLLLKFSINLLILTSVCMFFVAKTRKINFQLKLKFIYTPVLLIPAASLYIALMPFAKDIDNLFKFGINYETSKIVQTIPPSENIWINNYLAHDVLTELLQFYRHDTSIDPEWYASLNFNIPKKQLLKRTSPNTLMFTCTDPLFKEKSEDYKITKFVVIQSQVETFKFPDEDCLSMFDNSGWMKKQHILQFKNKQVHIFTVI